MISLEGQADNAKRPATFIGSPFMARDHPALECHRCLRPKSMGHFCLHDASTCAAHSGVTKAHDWMVGVLGPLFRTA